MRFRAVALLALAPAIATAQPPTPAPTDPPPDGPPPAGPAPPDSAPPPATDPTNTTPPATTPAPPAVEPSKPPAIATTPDPVTPALTTDPARAANLGFRFGSYGRIIAGTDLRGGRPESANVVAHGPRIVEPSYLELDLSYGFDTPSGKTLRPVITLAFNSTLFHETGDFDAQPALRNVFLDAQLTQHVTAWVGSRMYRGDDIYLFDYWPLDDLNTVGGGLFYRRAPLELAAHAGVNRLNNNFQFQEVDVANPEQGATTIVQLNRQRMVVSGTATYLLPRPADEPSIKLKLHGEVHALPSGTRKRIDGTYEELPADTGFLVGAQAGVFGWAPERAGFRRHLNVFARLAKGLAAFDELAPPTSVGRDLETTRANELSVGLSANWDTTFGHLMLGALSRRFIDADSTADDYDDGWEYAVDARPLVRLSMLSPELFVGGDISYQARFPRGLSPSTLVAQDPAVFQVAPMLVFSPMGPSGYDRPQLRLVYRAAYLNEAARDLFVPGDVRANRSVTHFLGFQAEWWFNSSTYR